MLLDDLIEELDKKLKATWAEKYEQSNHEKHRVDAGESFRGMAVKRRQDSEEDKSGPPGPARQSSGKMELMQHRVGRS